MRLGDGTSMSLSPDGKWVLSLTTSTPAQIVLLPTGAGDARQLSHDKIYHSWARWLPNSKGFVFTGTEEGHGARIYVQDTWTASHEPSPGRAWRPLFWCLLLTAWKLPPCWKRRKGLHLPSRRRYTAHGPRLSGWRTATTVGARWEIHLYLSSRELPTKIYRLDLVTGQRVMWKELIPSDPAGVSQIGPVIVTPTANAYVYGYHRTLSDLYLVDGLK